MSEANRYAQSKDLLYASTRGLKGISNHNLGRTSSDKHGGPFTTRPPSKFVWGQPPSAVRRAQLG